MIYVKGSGWMCNNILQYAHFYAWGREHGRETMSMRFAHKFQHFHICDTPHHNFWRYVVGKYAAAWGLIPTLEFREAGADTARQEQEMLRHKHIAVVGWEARWYDLFLKYKQEILQLFAFKKSVAKACEKILAETPQGSCRLGVHVRRGDYATWYGGRYFYSDEQFVSLIRQFLVLHPEAVVYICGNDPSLNKDLYRKALADTRVVFPEGNAAEDLYVLSECDYLIGPPSTFSLTASMYHDTPLYWIKDAGVPLTDASFGHFDDLFRKIL